MYFYRILSGGYESHNEETFASEVKYTKKELEDIVVDAYRASCEYYIEQDDMHVCFSAEFTPTERIFDYEGFTIKYLKDKYGLVKPELEASVFIDDTHYGRSSSLDERFNKELDNISIDESCWDNNCWRLDEDDDKTWYREKCLICKRKSE